MTTDRTRPRTRIEAIGARLATIVPEPDIAEESKAIVHVAEMLRRAARWAFALDVCADWHRHDYAAHFGEPGADAETLIAAIIDRGRRDHAGGAAGYPLLTRTYLRLALRWAWLEEADAAFAVGQPDLRAPYAPILDLLAAGAVVTGERGFLQVGAASLWIGDPARHLEAGARSA